MTPEEAEAIARYWITKHHDPGIWWDWSKREGLGLVSFSDLCKYHHDALIKFAQHLLTCKLLGDPP